MIKRLLYSAAMLILAPVYAFLAFAIVVYTAVQLLLGKAQLDLTEEKTQSKGSRL